MYYNQLSVLEVNQKLLCAHVFLIISLVNMALTLVTCICYNCPDTLDRLQIVRVCASLVHRHILQDCTYNISPDIFQPP